MSGPGLVTAFRGGVPESRHIVHAAVVGEDGRLLASAGDAARLTTMRSAAKPFQAEPLLASGGFDALGYDDRILAVMCASHLGEDVHAEAVARGLAGAGLGPDDLDNCAGGPDTRLRHNCSGNHLAFLASSVHHGWATAGYRRPGHPSQAAALAVVAEAAGVPAEAVETCTDGCGVVAFALPLATIAGMYARLARRLPRQDAAMRAHPELVRGRGSLDTELMRALPGAAAKGGAEALQCVALPDGVGVAVRVEDGNPRGLDAAVVEVLRRFLDWAEPPEALRPFARPPVRNAHHEAVGELRASVPLVTPS